LVDQLNLTLIDEEVPKPENQANIVNNTSRRQTQESVPSEVNLTEELQANLSNSNLNVSRSPQLNTSRSQKDKKSGSYKNSAEQLGSVG